MRHGIQGGDGKRRGVDEGGVIETELNERLWAGKLALRPLVGRAWGLCLSPLP